MKVKPNVRWAILSALIAIMLTSSVVFAQTFPKSLTGWLIAKRLTVDTISTLTGNVTAAADVAVGDDLTIADDVTVGGSLALTAQSVITVTNGATLSPAGSYQPIASAGAVGFGAITIASAGTELVLVNTVNQTITITDAGTLKLAGNIALGQYDALILISDGTNWIQKAPVGNN